MAYMSPEQFHEMVGKESDQYALGCIAYELFTGHMPFVASSPAALITKCLMEQPIPPRHHNSQLSENIEKVVLRAIAKQRRDRFPDVESFIAALQNPSSNSVHKTRQEWLSKFTAIAMAYPGNKEKIITACDEALQEDSRFDGAYYCKGVALNDLGRHKEALTAFERAIQFGANYSLAGLIEEIY